MYYLAGQGSALLIVEYKNGMIYNTIIMKDLTVIFDTSIIFFALQSRNGVSYKLFEKLLNEEFSIAISVPLVMEYEAMLKKKLVPAIYTEEDIDNVIDYLCLIGKQTKIYYLWRPHLKDAFDDHVLEVALYSGVSYIVTHNIKDFTIAKEMGIIAITPREFLILLEEKSL